MTIKYIPEGDKFRASQLWGEGRHQLSILKNLMSFGDLQQDQRTVPFGNDGTIIKCLSCFGQDVITIFVPQVFVGGEPEYREREETAYYPAIEVYDGASIHATYVGVVLCKGGGFEPPYEFISKDSLPRDTSTAPKDKLPEERIWESEEGREFEDIVPKGIADVELAVATDPTPSIVAIGNYYGLITRAERTWWESASYVDCWDYRAKSAAKYIYDRTENFRRDYVFSYSLPGDSDPGYWPSYLFEGVLQQIDKKPTNALSLSGTLYRDVQGSGSNKFFQYTAPSYYDVQAYAMKFEGGIWVRDDENVNFTSIITASIARSESHFSTHGDPADAEFPAFSSGAKRTGFYFGDYSYSYLDDFRWVWDFYGSVMDGHHYALAYSMKNDKKQANCYREITDITECILLSGYDNPAACDPEARTEDIIIDEQTEGPLCVVVDGVIFELFPETAPETSPRIQGCFLRYFRVGNRSIGLFRIVKNYDYPLDYIYVYAEALTNDANLTSKAKNLVISPVIPDDEALAENDPQLVGASTNRFTVKTDLDEIVYMKDPDGNTLYGTGGMRLIKETVVIKEMATAEQPGLFRKIT